MNLDRDPHINISLMSAAWPHPDARKTGAIPRQDPRVKESLAGLNEVKGLVGCDRIAAGNPKNGDSAVPLPTDFFRGHHGLKEEYDLVIIGAGLSGCVFAERATREHGKRCLIVDKRDHIGGNCYDYIDEHGIRVSE